MITAGKATLEAAIKRTEKRVRLLKMMPLTCRHRRVDVTREIKNLELLHRLNR